MPEYAVSVTEAIIQTGAESWYLLRRNGDHFFIRLLADAEGKRPVSDWYYLLGIALSGDARDTCLVAGPAHIESLLSTGIHTVSGRGAWYIQLDDYAKLLALARPPVTKKVYDSPKHARNEIVEYSETEVTQRENGLIEVTLHGFMHYLNTRYLRGGITPPIQVLYNKV